MIKIEGNSVEFEGTGEQLVGDFAALAYTLIFNEIPYTALEKALASAKIVCNKHDGRFLKGVTS